MITLHSGLISSFILNLEWINTRTLFSLNTSVTWYDQKISLNPEIFTTLNLWNYSFCCTEMTHRNTFTHSLKQLKNVSLIFLTSQQCSLVGSAVATNIIRICHVRLFTFFISVWHLPAISVLLLQQLRHRPQLQWQPPTAQLHLQEGGGKIFTASICCIKSSSWVCL